MMLFPGEREFQVKQDQSKYFELKNTLSGFKNWKYCVLHKCPQCGTDVYRKKIDTQKVYIVQGGTTCIGSFTSSQKLMGV